MGSIRNKVFIVYKDIYTNLEFWIIEPFITFKDIVYISINSKYDNNEDGQFQTISLSVNEARSSFQNVALNREEQVTNSIITLLNENDFFLISLIHYLIIYLLYMYVRTQNLQILFFFKHSSTIVSTNLDTLMINNISQCKLSPQPTSFALNANTNKSVSLALSMGISYGHS